MSAPPFHLAIPVHDLEAARAFYGGVLGCREGRAAERWVDFDFFGHQLSCHLADVDPPPTNEVDGDAVPVRHFGLVLPWDEWERQARHLEAAGVRFLIRPRVRFAGQPGEQGTLFVRDPSGNAIELKSFRDPARLSAR
ncbi:MAG: glyoxalase [Myxococcales bacterium]|nr:glyoxalase [Myxococcales bacterium]